MVGTTSAAGVAGGPGAGPDVAALQAHLVALADRFVQVNPDRGSVTVNFTQLADLVADVVTVHAATLRALNAHLHRDIADRQRRVRAADRLRTGLCGVLGHDPNPDGYPGDERVLADLRELAGEARTRENEVISLGCEVEKLERALLEAARDSPSADRFVTTMLGGGR